MPARAALGLLVSNVPERERCDLELTAPFFDAPGLGLISSTSDSEQGDDEKRVR